MQLLTREFYARDTLTVARALLGQHIVRKLPDLDLIPSVRHICEQMKIATYAVPGSEALGVEIVNRPVATVKNGYVRHHPGHLARELILLHAERSVRIAGDKFDFSDDTYQVEKRKK